MDYNSIINGKQVDALFVFKDDDECLQMYFDLKYEGDICRKCSRPIVDNYKRSTNISKTGVRKKLFRCKSCHTCIYPLADTVFRRTTIPIRIILTVIFLMTRTSKSLSAISVTRYVGITYNSAHKLLMQIRSCMYNDTGFLKGNVEIDEVFIGKGSKVYNWSAISTRKQPIIGMIERETKQAKVFLVETRSRKTLRELIFENVKLESVIYTDGWAGYEGLNSHYTHYSVDHSKREFVRGNVHTNTIENMWGGFKRNIRGEHIKITAKYVGLYMNELCWKHNHRKEKPMLRFDKLLRRTFYLPTSGYVRKEPTLNLSPIIVENPKGCNVN